MSEALQRFAAEMENAIEDAKRRGVDLKQLEYVLQIAAQDIREERDDGS